MVVVAVEEEKEEEAGAKVVPGICQQVARNQHPDLLSEYPTALNQADPLGRVYPLHLKRAQRPDKEKTQTIDRSRGE